MSHINEFGQRVDSGIGREIRAAFKSENHPGVDRITGNQDKGPNAMAVAATIRNRRLCGRLTAVLAGLAMLSGCAAGDARPIAQQADVDPAVAAEIAEESFGKAAALSRDGRIDESVQWYRRAATHGHAGAQWVLGTMYLTGRGVDADPAAAAAWYRQAADAGNAWAQLSLANMYVRGEGVSRDTAEAARLLGLAADQGHPQAQFNLGALYYNGEGVERDYAVAQRWLEKAARQGNAEAQYTLGRMYSAPHDGVGLDRMRAHAWYSLAAASGNEPSRQEAASLARTMSAAERAASRALARRLAPETETETQGL